MSIDDDFAPAEESIDWAEGATRELHVLIQLFFEGDVARIVVEPDLHTGENVEKIKFTSDIPKDFKRKATEALNNARHSYDQSIFAAKKVLAGRAAKKGNIYPWSQNPKDLDRLLRARRIDQRLWDTIRAHEPYPTSDTHVGGNDIIRSLATTANMKHTVGLTVHGHIVETRFPEAIEFVGFSFKLLSPQWDPRKKEAELMRWAGNTKVKGNYKFKFSICLKDTGLPEPIDVIGGLQLFTQKAKVVHETLKRKCFELKGG